MDVRVDTGSVVGAAARLEMAADAARQLARHCRPSGAGVVDPALAEALALVGDVCGDVLEVVGLDLDLLSTLVRSGAQLYASVEDDVVGAVHRGGPR